MSFGQISMKKKTEGFFLHSILILLVFSLGKCDDNSNSTTVEATNDNSTSKLSKIRIKDKWFVDENGRVMLFHGVNAVQKSPDWVPDKGNAPLFRVNTVV